MGRLLGVMGLVAVGACGPSQTGGAADAGRDLIGFADAGPRVDAGRDRCSEMDILFVVDNSGSMRQEQENLALNFPEFISVLDESESNLDYRVGVTTTGVDFRWKVGLPRSPWQSQTGASGAMRNATECGMTRPWVEASDSNASAAFSCAAQVGDDGPTMEMPLRAMHLALSDRIADGTNAGFRRPDALLAVVMLTDEDDCSYVNDSVMVHPFGSGALCNGTGMASPAFYAEFLDGLTGEPGRWATAVIAGPGPDQCESDFGVARPADRLREFVGHAGDNGVFSSICEGDLARGLQDALNTFDSACQKFPPVE